MELILVIKRTSFAFLFTYVTVELAGVTTASTVFDTVVGHLQLLR